MSLSRRTASTLAMSLLVSVVPAHIACAQVFQGLGDLPGGSLRSSGALRVSRDGSTVVGYGYGVNGYEAFRWTQATGMVGLGDFPGGLVEDGSIAYSVNADGSVVVGSGTEDSQAYTAFRWMQATGLVSLGDIDADPATSSYADDVSDDGSVIALEVGFRGNGPGMFLAQAARWTAASGLTGLGYLPGGDFSFAYALSADGSVIVGGGTIAGGGYHAFRWTQGAGMVSLGDVPGGEEFSFAQDVTSDGAVIVGRCATEEGYLAMRWTQAGGMVSLGDLPGGPSSSWAIGVSDDGNTVVGIANSTYDIDGEGEAFIWTPERGMRPLKDALMADYNVPQLEGWHLINAWSVSGDGRVIVGEGVNPQGDREGFIVRLAAGGPCTADFNGDGVVNSDDYFAFLTAFFKGC